VSWTHTRSKLAHTLKTNPDADVTELRRQLKTERLTDYIEKTLDAAPELTDAQRDRIAEILRGGAS
jgi:hypothetical protein